ncbi:hypothetical protein APICC_02492 [Apis cerana cerana]|uniref:Uncharacterized protein n=1 Tax=Apis cerana cerana TaxID=94128 RepID=A0A2A3ETI7_APICC|nr:hypothetical protein APICC_02492 [Apis cerana cerana]
MNKALIPSCMAQLRMLPWRAIAKQRCSALAINGVVSDSVILRRSSANQLDSRTWIVNVSLARYRLYIYRDGLCLTDHPNYDRGPCLLACSPDVYHPTRQFHQSRNKL